MIATPFFFLLAAADRFLPNAEMAVESGIGIYFFLDGLQTRKNISAPNRLLQADALLFLLCFAVAERAGHCPIRLQRPYRGGRNMIILGAAGKLSARGFEVFEELRAEVLLTVRRYHALQTTFPLEWVDRGHLVVGLAGISSNQMATILFIQQKIVHLVILLHQPFDWNIGTPQRIATHGLCSRRRIVLYMPHWNSASRSGLDYYFGVTPDLS